MIMLSIVACFIPTWEHLHDCADGAQTVAVQSVVTVALSVLLSIQVDAVSHLTTSELIVHKLTLYSQLPPPSSQR